MSSLYEQFNCRTKEELYEKVKNEDLQVKPLLDFIEFAKADIRNKNKAIKSPDIFVDYVKSTTMPTKDTGTIIFVDTKNQPVFLKRTRLSRKNDIKETLKEGLISGGTRAFIAFSEDTPNNRISQLQSTFENIGIKIIDSLGYSKDKDIFISSSVGRSFYASNSYEIINDGNDEYLKDDFSFKEEYTDFSSYFAKNEMIGLKIIDETDSIKEKLKIGFQHHHQEVFGIIAYDNDEKVILAEELFKGGMDSSIVDLKVIAKKLLRLDDLKGVAIFHNHPSGNPTPSMEDISMTDKVAQMCEALGVEFLDHYIVGKEKILSFSKEVNEFQSKNFRYQDMVKSMKNVSEKGIDYDNNKGIMDIKRGDVVKTSLSDATIVLEVKGEDALLFDGRQYIEAHGIQRDGEKVFWNQGHNYDTIPNEIFTENRKGYEDIKDTINDIINSNYQDFVKTLISIEKGIVDESILDEMYDRFMDNDGINLINDYFDDVLYDLEHENTVGEIIDTKIVVEKPMTKEKIGKLERASLLNELKANVKLSNEHKNEKGFKKDGVEL